MTVLNGILKQLTQEGRSGHELLFRLVPTAMCCVMKKKNLGERHEKLPKKDTAFWLYVHLSPYSINYFTLQVDSTDKLTKRHNMILKDSLLSLLTNMA